MASSQHDFGNADVKSLLSTGNQPYYLVGHARLASVMGLFAALWLIKGRLVPVSIRLAHS
jgi:hypothetical protein